MNFVGQKKRMFLEGAFWRPHGPYSKKWRLLTYIWHSPKEPEQRAIFYIICHLLLVLLVGNFKFALFVIPPTFAIPSASKLACVLLAPVASYTRKPQPKEWQKSKFN